VVLVADVERIGWPAYASINRCDHPHRLRFARGPYCRCRLSFFAAAPILGGADLVATVRKGVNDGESGDVLRHTAQWRCVRGVKFQPVQDTGPNEGFVADQNRIVLSEIRRAILDQWGVFEEDDIIRLPCNPEAISIGYGLRDGTVIRPVSHLFPQEILVREAPNSVTFESDPQIRARLIEPLSLSCAG
jgi:7,8-dihydro-6-hydroxymethylpterin dimethyltransferase